MPSYVIIYEDESRGPARSWAATLKVLRFAIAEKRRWPEDRLRPIGVWKSS
jgi:hypothetical protein